VPAVAVGSAAAVTAGAAAFALGVALVLAQAGRVLSLRYGR
jgi:hypothetical protein